MKLKIRNLRPGSSLVEMLIFLLFFAASTGAILSVFLSSNEQQVRQQYISVVDQTGVQLLQTVTKRIRRAERIIDPALGQSGKVLAVQMPPEEENPTIILIMSGAMMAGETDSVLPLTSSGKVTVSNFRARNTSVSADRQSVLISFDISSSVPIPTAPDYTRSFEGLVTLFPDDQEQGDDCGCVISGCISNIYYWQYCNNDVCTTGPTTLSCGD